MIIIIITRLHLDKEGLCFQYRLFPGDSGQS